MIARLFCLLAAACGSVIGAHKASGDKSVSYRQTAALSLTERRVLNQKAERGDDKAALALALYYAAVAPNIKNREYFLILASKSGSRESIEALADFYSMPGGVFRLQKAISLRKELKSRFPNDVDNIDWAEGCAFEYHYLTTGEARRKELAFLKLAASWGSLKAKDALQTIRIDSATPIAVARSKGKQSLPAAETNDFLRIPTDRITVLRKKAKRGDSDAAERLGLYYGIYRNDKKRALHHLKIAAAQNSDVAIRNLITTYSTDPDFFNFKKALGFRAKLKRIAEAKKIDVQPDADWSYHLYLEHFLAAGNKRLGIFFLKYAARQGFEQARNELIEIYAKDSDLRNPKKAGYWKKKSDVSNSNATVADAGRSAISDDGQPTRSSSADAYTHARADDYGQIIAVVLDEPKLQNFLHPDVEGRKPLIVSDENVPHSVSLNKFGMPVRILPKKMIVESKLRAFIEFIELRVETERADVTLHYAIEGVRMKAQLVKTDGKWIITYSDLVET